MVLIQETKRERKSGRVWGFRDVGCESRTTRIRVHPLSLPILLFSLLFLPSFLFCHPSLLPPFFSPPPFPSLPILSLRDFCSETPLSLYPTFPTPRNWPNRPSQLDKHLASIRCLKTRFLFSETLPIGLHIINIYSFQGESVESEFSVRS